MHFQQGNVVLIGELVKIPVGDNFLYPAVQMSVSLVGVENVVFSNSYQKIAWSDILKFFN